jgi:hypothetical protein
MNHQLVDSIFFSLGDITALTTAKCRMMKDKAKFVPMLYYLSTML